MAWLGKVKTSGTVPDVETKSTLYSGTSVARRPYVDYNEEWSIDRAVKDALTRVTWVYRCVQVIASNAAKVPLVLREDDRINGEISEGNPLLAIFNSRSNPGESAFTFRYRLSAQLLLSNKGVFVEITRKRNGEIDSLRLLPPDCVTPIKDAVNFVKGYKFEMVQYDQYGQPAKPIRKTYKPEEIMWIRIPHPFDPYKALTPLDSIGLSVETDWYAKMYNRNFLLNDGRPGGMVVLKGEATEEDKSELQSRFRGNVQMAGRITVVTAEQGADFVDTAVTPRDAQYQETRNLTKEEILIGFGVPESVLPNAAGRTFDNAEIERLIFWQETMLPHLQLISMELDVLDEDPSIYVSPDTDKVDVLQRMDMKRQEFKLKEFDSGVTDVDEYRAETGREELADGQGKVMFIPKTKVPYATTDGSDFHQLITDGASVVAPAAAGKPPNGAVATDIPDGEPVQREDDRQPQLPSEEANKMVGEQGPEEIEGPLVIVPPFEVKEYQTGIDRWGVIYESTLTRVVDRQKRVVSEKMAGSKMRKLLGRRERALNAGEKSVVTPKMALDTVYDKSVWDQQLTEDIRPVLSGVVKEFGEAMAADFDPQSPEAQAIVDSRVKSISKVNSALSAKVEASLAAGILGDLPAERIAGRINSDFDNYAEKSLPDLVLDEIEGTVEDVHMLISKNSE